MMDEHNLMVAAEAYFTERRRLGFKERHTGNRVQSFARYAVAKGHSGHVTADLCLEWAKQGALYDRPFTWAGRLASIRRFVDHLAQRDPRTEFPAGMPFGPIKRRRTPHIYTAAEIEELMALASTLAPAGGLRAANFTTLIGLLAATGMRISEALMLECRDFDRKRGLLTIRRTKSRRERRLPIQPTVTNALSRYLAIRSGYASAEPSAPLFISAWKYGPLPYATVQATFRKLALQLGIFPRGGYRYVRIHDLRHSFICHRLMAWQRDGVSTDNAMLALSTYVGHANVADTYWYLEGIPELMAIAGSRFEGSTGREGLHHG
ncbi:MAG: tyrosine-type recombinase/integrase [Sphingomonadaceae bacterium]